MGRFAVVTCHEISFEPSVVADGGTTSYLPRIKGDQNDPLVGPALAPGLKSDRRTGPKVRRERRPYDGGPIVVSILEVVRTTLVGPALAPGLKNDRRTGPKVRRERRPYDGGPIVVSILEVVWT